MMYKIIVKTTIMFSVLGFVFGLPVRAVVSDIPDTLNVPEIIVVEEPIVVKEKPKEKTWEELTTIERVKKNPRSCDLTGGTEVMWGDGSCHKVTSVVANSVPSAIPYTVSGDWVAQCHAWAAQVGITLDSWAIELIDRESDCNPTIWNTGGSGAYGIAQALPASKLPNGVNTSPPQQILWMYNYVMSRYSSWEQAVYFHNSHNYY